MPGGLPIFLAAGESSGWDVLVWIVAAIIAVLSQINAAKKKQAKQARQAPAASSGPAAPGGGASPTAEELGEIFRRLGADIPGTPPPASKPAPARATPPRAPPPRPPPRVASRKPVAAPRVGSAARRPALPGQDLPRAAAVEPPAAPPIVQGVESRAGEHRALDTATRHTGAILPRMYAMGLRLAPWPVLPIPGFNRAREAGRPLRTRLHARHEIRDALIAQTYLRSPKSLAP